MTKITHKGLWFKYSSLINEDKNTTKKVFLWAHKKTFFVVFLSSLINEEYLNHNPLCVILVIISP